jgi:hypothetical protein
MKLLMKLCQIGPNPTIGCLHIVWKWLSRSIMPFLSYYDKSQSQDQQPNITLDDES